MVCRLPYVQHLLDALHHDVLNDHLATSLLFSSLELLHSVDLYLYGWVNLNSLCPTRG